MLPALQPRKMREVRVVCHTKYYFCLKSTVLVETEKKNTYLTHDLVITRLNFCIFLGRTKPRVILRHNKSSSKIYSAKNGRSRIQRKIHTSRAEVFL